MPTISEPQKKAPRPRRRFVGKKSDAQGSNIDDETKKSLVKSM